MKYLAFLEQPLTNKFAKHLKSYLLSTTPIKVMIRARLNFIRKSQMHIKL